MWWLRTRLGLLRMLCVGCVVVTTWSSLLCGRCSPGTICVPRVGELVSKIPLSQLVVETDAPYQYPRVLVDRSTGSLSSEKEPSVVSSGTDVAAGSTTADRCEPDGSVGVRDGAAHAVAGRSDNHADPLVDGHSPARASNPGATDGSFPCATSSTAATSAAPVATTGASASPIGAHCCDGGGDSDGTGSPASLNDPRLLPLILAEVCRYRSEPPEEVARACYANACRFFRTSPS